MSRTAARDRIGCWAGVRSGAGEVACGARGGARYSRCRVRCAGLTPADARRRLQSFTVSGRAAIDPLGWSLAPATFISAPTTSGRWAFPLVRGREFTELDDRHLDAGCRGQRDAGPPAFPDEDPIGRRIRINERSPMACCVAAGPVDGIWREIVGVVGDIRQANLDEAPAATIYRPYTPDFRARHVPVDPDADGPGHASRRRCPAGGAAQGGPTHGLVARSSDAPEYCGIGRDSGAAVRRPAARRFRCAGAGAGRGRAVRRHGVPRRRKTTRNRRAGLTRRHADRSCSNRCLAKPAGCW